MWEWIGPTFAIGKKVLGWYKDSKEGFKAAKEIYAAGKSVKERLSHKDEPAPTVEPEPELKEVEALIVDRDWLERSGFGALAVEQGYTLRWSKPDAVPTRERDGWELLYEIDFKAHTKRQLRYGGLVLIGKLKPA